MTSVHKSCNVSLSYCGGFHINEKYDWYYNNDAWKDDAIWAACNNINNVFVQHIVIFPCETGKSASSWIK